MKSIVAIEMYHFLITVTEEKLSGLELNTLLAPLLSDRSGVSGGAGLSKKSAAAQSKKGNTTN